jgi:integrase
MRGSLRRRDRRHTSSGPERWELRVYLGRDERGREKQTTRVFAGSKREAESALAAFVTEIERGRRSHSSRMPFGDFAKQWIESRKTSAELATKTIERYEGILRDHILPHFGQIVLSSIAASHIRNALGAWKTGKRHDRKTGTLSEKSVHDHFALLRQLLGDAVRERLLPDNPATFVRAPRKGGSRRRTYNMQQVVALVDFLRPTPLAIPVLVKALTGLRRGELLALRWRNIDLDKGIASVVESLTRDKNGNLSFKVPKTRKSARPLVLSPTLVGSLRAYRSGQVAQRELLGLVGEPDLVFCAIDGSPWDPDSFSSAFAYKMRESSLPRISLQELRHSYSSISQRSGTPLTTTSQAMGHSTTVLTGDVYSHALIEDFRSAADRIDASRDAGHRRAV